MVVNIMIRPVKCFGIIMGWFGWLVVWWVHYESGG